MADAERRVDLRELELDDAHEIGSWGLDDEFCRVAEWTTGLSLSELVDFQRQLINEPPDDLIRLGAVWGDVLIGYVVLEGGGASRELGYVVGPSRRWGMGFGSAVARAGLRHGFGQLGIQRIWAEARHSNSASIRILNGLGMTSLGPSLHNAAGDESECYERFEMTSDG